MASAELPIWVDRRSRVTGTPQASLGGSLVAAIDTARLTPGS
jgi:hypothetical protein